MTKCIKIKQTTIGAGIPKICVPITGINEDEIIRQTEQIAAGSPDLVEWRADFFAGVEDWQQVEKMLSTISAKLGEIPLIFTFRTKKEGGERQISMKNYVNLNKMVSETACADLIDIEVFQGESEANSLIAAIQRNGKRVIASNHHFHETPNINELLAIFRRMEDARADILKIAVMPKEEQDVLTLLAATSQMKQISEKPLITMAMSALGTPSRICGEFFGSAITFAAIGQVSAPGQLEFDSLKTILNILHAVTQN